VTRRLLSEYAELGLDSLTDGFRRLGIKQRQTVLVHSSLRAFGQVAGGAEAVVQALLTVLGPRGTVVVPTQTAYNRDPSRLKPPPPPDVIPWIWRRGMPAFDPGATPSRRMGRIAECVRTWPDARRSTHPQTSFAAVGPLAEYILDPHELPHQLDDRSPLGRLEEVGARILLLGVGFARCTAFHLAEYRLPDPEFRLNYCAVRTPAGREWQTYIGRVLNQEDFDRLGNSLVAETGLVATQKVGDACCHLVSLPDAVEYAEKWFRMNRTLPSLGPPETEIRPAEPRYPSRAAARR
jgi:aminoglycoside 3-N-acetyltransferase